MFFLDIEQVRALLAYLYLNESEYTEARIAARFPCINEMVSVQAFAGTKKWSYTQTSLLNFLRWWIYDSLHCVCVCSLRFPPNIYTHIHTWSYTHIHEQRSK